MNLLRASSSFVRGFSAQKPPTTEPGNRHCPGISIVRPQTPPWLQRSRGPQRVPRQGSWPPPCLCHGRCAPAWPRRQPPATLLPRVTSETQPGPERQPNHQQTPPRDGPISAQPQVMSALGTFLRPRSQCPRKGSARHGGCGYVCIGHTAPRSPGARSSAAPSTAGVNIQPVPVSCPVPAPGLIKSRVRGRHHTHGASQKAVASQETSLSFNPATPSPASAKPTTSVTLLAGRDFLKIIINQKEGCPATNCER